MSLEFGGEQVWTGHRQKMALEIRMQDHTVCSSSEHSAPLNMFLHLHAGMSLTEESKAVKYCDL